MALNVSTCLGDASTQFCPAIFSFCSQVAPQFSNGKIGLPGSVFALVDVIKNYSRRTYPPAASAVIMETDAVIWPHYSRSRNFYSLFVASSFPVRIRLKTEFLRSNHSLAEIYCKTVPRTTQNSLYFSLIAGNLGRRGVRLRLHPPPRSHQSSITIILFHLNCAIWWHYWPFVPLQKGLRFSLTWRIANREG
jgi:hypothetical protein